MVLNTISCRLNNLRLILDRTCIDYLILSIMLLGVITDVDIPDTVNVHDYLCVLVLGREA